MLALLGHVLTLVHILKERSEILKGNLPRDRIQIKASYRHACGSAHAPVRQATLQRSRSYSSGSRGAPSVPLQTKNRHLGSCQARDTSPIVYKQTQLAKSHSKCRIICVMPIVFCSQIMVRYSGNNAPKMLPSRSQSLAFSLSSVRNMLKSV